MYNPTIKEGFLEVIAGPMYSGKTLALVNRIKNVQYMNDTSFIILKPCQDTRDPEKLFTRGMSDSFPCEPIVNPSDIYEKGKDYDLVIIDEVHFLQEDAVNEILKLLYEKKNVIAAGLDLDFLSKPFPIMGKLCCYANEITKLTGICMKSKTLPGTRTQLLINGKPAPKGLDTSNWPEDRDKSNEKWEVRSLWDYENED